MLYQLALQHGPGRNHTPGVPPLLFGSALLPASDAASLKAPSGPVAFLAIRLPAPRVLHARERMFALLASAASPGTPAMETNRHA